MHQDPRSFDETVLSRRAFVHEGTLFLAGLGLSWSSPTRSIAAEKAEASPRVRIGLLTDLHYADKPTLGNRHYRETIAKLAEATGRFQQDKTDLVFELGDLVDSADSVEAEQGYLRRMVEGLAAAPGQHHYVLGNHCVYSLTKAEFLQTVGQKKTYYSFDFAGRHFVVLDACFRRDGTPYGRKNFDWTDASLPPAELDWLKSDLSSTSLTTLVFLHHRLDMGHPYAPRNAADVRAILERSGRIAAVFQGHYHKNDYREIGGIHYCTLAAMIDGSGSANSAYAVADILADGSIRVTGFRKQQSRHWRVRA